MSVHKCSKAAVFEVIWGAAQGQSRFSCIDHVGKLINCNAVVNTVMRLETVSPKQECDYDPDPEEKIYARKECIFKMCPQPELCKVNDKCCYPSSR